MLSTLLDKSKNDTELISRITDNSVLFIAFLGLPINLIAWFALENSEYFFPRVIPPLLEILFVLVFIFRNRIPLRPKLTWFIAALFATGCFLLLLGLLDMASLWFVLAIVYNQFIAEEKAAFDLFIASLGTVITAGFLMMTKITFIPLQYNFEPCQFACVSVRILHFILIGSLIYYILRVFFKEMNKARNEVVEAIILAEKAERKRLAADLHDGLGPTLSAIKLFFQAYVDAEKGQQSGSIAAKLNSTIDAAIKDVSRISHNISPHILEQHGLEKALKAFADALTAGRPFKVSVNIDSDLKIDPTWEVVLYRIMTELAHNTVKHAEASVIGIGMKNENGGLVAEYHDDGNGFEYSELIAENSGMGLANIQNRVNSLGGAIEIESAPQQGMQVRIVIPRKGTVADV